MDFSIEKLQENLRHKADWIRDHIRQEEWIAGKEGEGWYNGYYDNHGRKVEGENEAGERMMLTSQVFSIMSGSATDRQVEQIIKAADRYLYDEAAGGYRLNTDFHEVKMDLGRMFGFAYGHKENGSVFSHMAVMFGNALYTRGYGKEGYQVIHTLFSHCSNFEVSRIYPGVPEYIDEKGRGVYHYLTGAASWLLVTVMTQMFGVRGKMGSLELHPQLVREQFDQNKEAALTFTFAGKNLQIIYQNENELEAGEYSVRKVWLPDGSSSTQEVIPRSCIEALPEDKVNKIIVQLA